MFTLFSVFRTPSIMAPNGAPTVGDDGYLPLPDLSSMHDGTGLYKTPICTTPNTEPSPDDTQSDTGIVVPPDGGWGWVVVAGSFACNMIVDGIIFSFGMMLSQIAESFGATKAHVSLIGSLLSGVYLIAAPFAGAVSNRYGFRVVAIIGSFLAGLAFVISCFATSVTFLCVSYGIIGGNLF